MKKIVPKHKQPPRFVKPLAASTAKKLTPFDLDMAKQLIMAMRGQRVLAGQQDTAKWANEVRMLRTADHVSEAVVDKVFRWYMDNLNTTKLRLRSRLDVRRRFPTLQYLMERYIAECPHYGRKVYVKAGMEGNEVKWREVPPSQPRQTKPKLYQKVGMNGLEIVWEEVQ